MVLIKNRRSRHKSFALNLPTTEYDTLNHTMPIQIISILIADGK